MPTDEELADAYRLILDDYNNWAADPLDLAVRIDELDPPKPECAAGTPAYVTFHDGTTALCTRGLRGEWWPGGSQLLSSRPFHDSCVTKVEPLRVLGDDEIALPRRAFGGRDAEFARSVARRLRKYSSTAANALRAYADALDAEAGDRP